MRLRQARKADLRMRWAAGGIWERLRFYQLPPRMGPTKRPNLSNFSRLEGLGWLLSDQGGDGVFDHAVGQKNVK